MLKRSCSFFNTRSAVSTCTELAYSVYRSRSSAEANSSNSICELATTRRLCDPGIDIFAGDDTRERGDARAEAIAMTTSREPFTDTLASPLL